MNKQTSPSFILLPKSNAYLLGKVEMLLAVTPLSKLLYACSFDTDQGINTRAEIYWMFKAQELRMNCVPSNCTGCLYRTFREKSSFFKAEDLC